MANGTGSGASTPGATGLQSPLGTWAVGSDGTETLTRYYCESDSNGVGFCSANDIAWNVTNGSNYGQTRAWKLLATAGDNIYVMERLTDMGDSFDQYRVNVYTKTN